MVQGFHQVSEREVINAKRREAAVASIPESWLCVDCGVNTAPGMPNRADVKSAFAAAEARGEEASFDTLDTPTGPGSEVYTVRDAVWKASGMPPMGGCLCIGCLEKRLGRALRPKDFQKGHVFNAVPASPGLMRRQKRTR
jgi:hypothetical protein